MFFWMTGRSRVCVYRISSNGFIYIYIHKWHMYIYICIYDIYVYMTHIYIYMHIFILLVLVFYYIFILHMSYIYIYTHAVLYRHMMWRNGICNGCNICNKLMFLGGDLCWMNIPKYTHSNSALSCGSVLDTKIVFIINLWSIIVWASSTLSIPTACVDPVGNMWNNEEWHPRSLGY